MVSFRNQSTLESTMTSSIQLISIPWAYMLQVAHTIRHGGCLTWRNVKSFWFRRVTQVLFMLWVSSVMVLWFAQEISMGSDSYGIYEVGKTYSSFKPMSIKLPLYNSFQTDIRWQQAAMITQSKSGTSAKKATFKQSLLTLNSSQT